MHGIFHRAHLETLQVVGCIHRALVVGHVTKAVLAPRQRLDAFARKLGQHVLTDGAIKRGARVRVILEQERNIQNGDFRNKIGHRTRRRHREVERAELNSFDRLALGAKRARVEILHLVATVRTFLDFASKRIDRHTIVRILADRNIHLHGFLRGGRNDGQDGKNGNGDKRSGDAQQRHEILLGWTAGRRDLVLVETPGLGILWKAAREVQETVVLRRGAVAAGSLSLCEIIYS